MLPQLLFFLAASAFAAPAPNKVPYAKCVEVLEFLYDPQAKSSEHFVKVLENATSSNLFNAEERKVLQETVYHFRDKVFEHDFKKNPNIFRRHDQIRMEITQLKNVSPFEVREYQNRIQIAAFLFPRIEDLNLLEESNELLYHLKTLTSLCDFYR
ncbi:hypothetical protein L596_011365 [Steinernema carpocapsae]|uniref:SXP/RAL-2 family protein Ani s 5-like cation-binding domain-containing protein n=1 Tax=Steinernema carpocapsae TaxID=34508 RepID=A0A4U5NU35_STECR|nr:hypothetical protein L596_011365 [Steinernema carpocapsae]